MRKTVKKLHKKKFIKYRKNKQGECEAVLTDKGKKIALEHKLDSLKIKKAKKWDQKWRVVIFDVPEEKRLVRDVLRQRLKKLNFFELQKSVFVFPYDCKKEIDYVVKVYQAGEFVRFLVVEFICNDEDLRKRYKLN